MRKYTRKDIARLLDISYEQVRYNEKSLGLKAARLPGINRQDLRYDADKVDAALRQRGLLPGNCAVPQH